MHPFCLHRSSCLCSPPPNLLDFQVCQIFAISLWLIPNSMRKGVWWGEGEGSDLENLCVELSPPALPHPPVLRSLINYCWQSGDHQWLAAARQTWFGGWSVGYGRLKGWRVEEGRGKRSYKGLWSKRCREKSKTQQDPPGLNDPWTVLFIYENERSLRLSHMSRQLHCRSQILFTLAHAQYCPDGQALRQQHRNIAYKHKPFCCSDLWSSREIIYRL